MHEKKLKNNEKRNSINIVILINGAKKNKEKYEVVKLDITFEEAMKMALNTLLPKKEKQLRKL